MKKVAFCLVALLCVAIAEAKVSLPQFFQSGMVLQRGKAIPIWGKADAGETITIKFNKKTYSTTADAEGKWCIDLPKMKAGGPYVLEVRGKDGEMSEISDVLIGDVWLLSGQSNIDVHIERVYPQYTQEVDGYENSQIRLFRVQNDTDTHGVKDDIRPTATNWKPLNKQNAWPFSAVGYFLGKRMFEKTKVAQGIIVNSWGGTPIEAWIPKDSLEKDYPHLIKRVQFFQSDEYVMSQRQTNMYAERQWQKILQESDPGIQENWTAADLNDTEWKSVSQWDTQWALSPTTRRPIVGTIWLRQHINIDKEHAGKPARLLLGTLYDRDVTYLNGQKIGETGYQYPPRRYDIPEGLLREGDNVITVRFINKNGLVHFIPEKPYLIAFGEDRCSQNPMPKDVVPLSETWKFCLGAEMPNCPGGDVSLQNIPTTLYNAVLYPLAPYALSGVVWYQGESNTGNPVPYADYLKKLMGSWRACWQNQQMPFVIVQLANYDGRQQTGFPQPIMPQPQPVNSGWAQLREAQRVVAKADPYAELAVINDLGETVDIHPLRKKEVAERIGLCFDRLVYNNKVSLAPEVVTSEVKDNKLILTLDQPVEAGEMKTFEVAGEDGKFVNASATANGNTITVFSPLTSPLKLRYAWKDNPIMANVRSLSGLPMSSFELIINK
jgi:sialate O-acetylesterase